MGIRVKLLDPKAYVPERAHQGDAGADLFAVHSATINPGCVAKIGIGIAVEIPPGFEGQIRPRSSLLSKGIIGQLGTLDAGYRGEIAAILHNTTRESYAVKVGDRVAQLVVSPVVLDEYVPCAELSASDRGVGGFGSTGSAGRIRVPSNGG